MRLAVLIPPADYQADWSWAFDPQASALREAGVAVDAIPWTDAGSVRSYNLILPLVAWGYHARYAQWLALLDWLERGRIPVANPIEVLRWNGDKAYLADLNDKGVATVPSLAFTRFNEQALTRAREVFGCSELVVKPTISATAHGTYRLDEGDPFPEPVRGWRMLVQPWLREIVTSGEWSLLFFAGEFSHAVSKVPKPGEFRVQQEYGGLAVCCEPPAGAVRLAQAALAVAPAPTTYARVDIVVGNDGDLQIIELELIEPELFLAQAPDAAPRFAMAVLSAAGHASE